MPSTKVLQQLQEALLGAVLFGRRLPGGAEPVRFPDLSFVLRHPTTFVLDANLSGPISVRDSGRPIRIVSREDLLREAQASGSICYLQFQPPEMTAGAIGLTLEARITEGNQGERVMGLSSIHVKFVGVGDQWDVMDGPVYSAA